MVWNSKIARSVPWLTSWAGTACTVANSSATSTGDRQRSTRRRRRADERQHLGTVPAASAPITGAQVGLGESRGDVERVPGGRPRADARTGRRRADADLGEHRLTSASVWE